MLDNLIVSSSECLFVLNKFTQIKYVSNTLSTYWNISRKEIINDNFSDFFDARDYKGTGIQKMLDRLSEKNLWEGELCISFGKSKPYFFESKMQIIGDKTNPLYILILNNTSRQLDVKTKFLRMQKLETLGQMSCKVAHDFNNILTIAGGYADLLKNEVGEDHKHICSEILNSVEKASELSENLLNYGSHHSEKRSIFNLSSLINRSESMLKQLLSEDITLTFQLTRKNTNIYADYSKIQHLLINLVINAKDAIASNPTADEKKIEIAVESIGKKKAVESYAVPGKGYNSEFFVLLRVSDTGLGISPDYGNKIFKPFFTTKEADAGSGLGLSSVQDIAKDAGGVVLFESIKNEGTTFFVVFPAAD